ncbi:MAG: NEAT domain-containing protein [Candidatus Cohnella colombiensis]|uniref:NEAT domain-containing protein n=1 Tax=Candidatus Cohnella colombiensis TaxID=3121368 RepID=A0AA95EWI7_9BACL|nr:MAG: NEAT domain-containing protein [Cohnella sp.]
MNKSLMKFVAVLSFVVTLLASVQLSTASAAGQSGAIPDGEYSIKFTALQATEDTASSMNNYFVDPKKLTVKEGKTYISFTIKDSPSVAAVQYANDGTNFVDSVIVSTDEATKTRVAQIEVADLSKVLAGKVHVVTSYVAGGQTVNYDKWHDFRYSFDLSSIRAATNEGGNSSSATVERAYTIAITALQATEDTASSMNSYFIDPKKLVVKNGKSYVQFTVKDSKSVAAIQYANDGTNFVDSVVVSTDDAANTRVAEIEVEDVTKVLAGKVHVVTSYVAGGQTVNYDKWHDFRFKFDTSASKPITSDSSSTETTPSTEAKFSDIEGHWAKALIEKAVRLGVVSGYADGTFKPDGDITRAEFTAMISRVLKLEAASTELSFKDASQIPAWAKPYVAQAVKSNIITGFDDNTFRAGEPITRAQLAVMIARAAHLPLDPNATLSFDDKDQVQTWAKPYVAAAVKAGLVREQGNNLFAPKANATRAEAAAYIVGLLN